MYLLKVNFVIFDRKYMVSYSNLCWYSFSFFFFFLRGNGVRFLDSLYTKFMLIGGNGVKFALVTYYLWLAICCCSNNGSYKSFIYQFVN